MQYHFERRIDIDEDFDHACMGIRDVFQRWLKNQGHLPDHAPALPPPHGHFSGKIEEPFRFMKIYVPFPIVGWNEATQSPIYGDEPEWHLRVDTLTSDEP